VFADVNHDGSKDVVAFDKSTVSGAEEGDVWVGLSNGVNAFAPGQKWSDWMCVRDETCAVADVDGNGGADLVSFVTSGADAGQVWVALNHGDGTGFGPAELWTGNSMCVGDAACTLLDFNGDHNADVLVQPAGSTDVRSVWVSLAGGHAFGTPTAQILRDGTTVARDNDPNQPPDPDPWDPDTDPWDGTDNASGCDEPSDRDDANDMVDLYTDVIINLLDRWKKEDPDYRTADWHLLTDMYHKRRDAIAYRDSLPYVYCITMPVPMQLPE
jgi:hypothetical protein